MSILTSLASAVEAEAPGDAAGAVAERLRRITARVHDGGRGAGAGVVWRPDGLIVTNAHVVRGGRSRVELADGRVLAARVVARDADRDLAALRVDASGLPAATLGDPLRVRVGDLVVAMGHPLGVKDALSLGIVHAVERGSPGTAPRWIRADVRLAPGNSGGPLADAEGRVLGINTLIHRGLGLAVPGTTVARFLAPADTRRTLGVVVHAVGVRAPAGIGPGWLVLETLHDGAAARAGLLPGDVLIGAGGRRFETTGDLGGMLRDAAAGVPLRLELIRGGRGLTLEVALHLARAAPEAA